MPIVATATLKGRGRPLPLSGGGTGRGPLATASLWGSVAGGPAAILQGTVSRSVVESFSAPSVFYTFAVKLGDTWLPSSSIAGPLEIDESIDTPATLFTFTLVGRQYSIHLTEKTWTNTPVEIWVTVLLPLSRSAGEGAGGGGELGAEPSAASSPASPKVNLFSHQ